MLPLVLLLSAIPYTKAIQKYEYSIDQAASISGSATNGSNWRVARFLVKDTSTKVTKSVSSCGTGGNALVSDDTISILCLLSGYSTYVQLTNKNLNTTWSESRDVGYNLKCKERDTFNKCKVEVNENCTDVLVVNCTVHYTSMIGGMTANDLIIPVILIPICFLYVIVLCYLDSEDSKKTAAERKRMMAQHSVQAFGGANSKDSKENNGNTQESQNI